MKNKDPRSEPTSFTPGGSRLKLTQLTMSLTVSPCFLERWKKGPACYLSSKSSSDLPEQLDEDCRPRVHATPVPKGEPTENTWKEILGRKGSSNYFSHKLAQEQIKSGKPITVKIINDILAYCGITITEEILKSLLAAPSFVLDDLGRLDETGLVPRGERDKILKDKIGGPFDKMQVPGIYIFRHKETGAKYVGSSSQLGIRLYGNFSQRNGHRSVGKLIPLITKDKLSSFTLEIVPLHDNYEFRSEIVLEQYYLLDPSFTLNTVKVANNPSGSNAKPLYMYNRDKSILYYSSTQQKDFIVNLNIAHFTFNKHLKNGTYYLGKYHFTREPILTAKVEDISLLDLALMLEKDRVVYNKNKPVNSFSKSVLLEDINNSNTEIFFSIGKCVEYLRKKGLPANQKSLVKYINSGKVYHGFICKFVTSS